MGAFLLRGGYAVAQMQSESPASSGRKDGGWLLCAFTVQVPICLTASPLFPPRWGRPCTDAAAELEVVKAYMTQLGRRQSSQVSSFGASFLRIAAGASKATPRGKFCVPPVLPPALDTAWSDVEGSGKAAEWIRTPRGILPPADFEAKQKARRNRQRNSSAKRETTSVTRPFQHKG